MSAKVQKEARPVYPRSLLGKLFEDTLEELKIFCHNRAIDPTFTNLIDDLVMLYYYEMMDPESFPGPTKGLDGWNREVEATFKGLAYELDWLGNHRVPTPEELKKYNDKYQYFRGADLAGDQQLAAAPPSLDKEINQVIKLEKLSRWAAPESTFYFERIETKGIAIIDRGNGIFVRCEKCQETWRPKLRPGGRFARGYWKCPKGCNS